MDEEEKIRSYLEELNTLKMGEGAVAKLIACGRSAIEPLRQFLLFGKPSVVHHSRRWAVEALAGLEAGDVLFEYLKQKKDIADPDTRLAEEVVESAAALELARWPSEEVSQLLLGIARERCLTGALEALGKLKRAEAVPSLVKALEDDVCRKPAEDALRKIGRPAIPVLIEGSTSPWPSRDGERPSSLLRRRSAVILLAEMGVASHEWPLLRSLLNESDAEILVATFRIAVAAAGPSDRALAFRLLMRLIENGDWYLRDEIEYALIDCFEAMGPTLEKEIGRRSQRSEGKSIADPVLSSLLRVKYRADDRQRIA